MTVPLPASLAFVTPSRVRKGGTRVLHIVPRDERFGFVTRTALCGSTPASGFYEPHYRVLPSTDARCQRCERKFAAAVVRALCELAGWSGR